MAYEYTENKDDEEKASGAPQPNESGGGLVGGGVASSGLSGGGQGSAPAAPFANVKEFLDANQNQAVGLANKLGSSIVDRGEKVRSDIGAQRDAFNQKVNENTVQTNKDILNQAGSDPLTFVKSQGNVNAFTKMRDAAYGGPSNLQDFGAYAPLQSAAQGVIDRGKLVDTDAGRETLLGEISKRPSAGKNALDNLLLSGNKDALGALQSAKNKESDLLSYLDSINAQAGETSNKAKADTEATKNYVQDYFKGSQGVIPTLQNQVNTRFADTKSQAENSLNSLNALNGKPTDWGSTGWRTAPQGYLDNLGLSRDQLRTLQEREEQLKGFGKSPLDFNQYVTKQSPDAAITLNNVASKDELARAQALASLFGEKSFLPEDISQGGTANPNMVAFNKDSALKDIGSLLASAERAKVAKDLGDWYYNNIGERTGQGWAPAYNGRDVVATVNALLSPGRTAMLEPDNDNRYFGYGFARQQGMDRYFYDQIQKARDYLNSLNGWEPSRPDTNSYVAKAGGLPIVLK